MIEQTFLYKCDHCSNVKKETVDLGVYSVPARPYHPDGWICFDNVVICDKHVITVVDKEPVNV